MQQWFSLVSLGYLWFDTCNPVCGCFVPSFFGNCMEPISHIQWTFILLSLPTSYLWFDTCNPVCGCFVPSFFGNCMEPISHIQWTFILLSLPTSLASSDLKSSTLMTSTCKQNRNINHLSLFKEKLFFYYLRNELTGGVTHLWNRVQHLNLHLP